jgi:hypothetical protein
MNPLDALREWFLVDTLFADFEFCRGGWRDTPGNKAKCLAAMIGQGGGGPLGSINWQSVRVVLLGPVDGKAQQVAVEDAALSTMHRLETDFQACGIAHIKLQGGIIGPGTTAENRPWYELNFSLML